MRDVNANVAYRGLWGALSCVQGLLILIEDELLAQGQLAARLLNSGWVLPSPPPLQHVSCGKVRLDPAEAVARKVRCLSAWHHRLQERSWLCFLPGRVICTKVRRERNWLVSDRISKHCDLILCPKCKYILSLAGEGHKEVWHHHKA